ncbi:MAG: hypothetical protein COA44_03885 [Arcobacter sp.]|nr:MAG: hypothetical protein COA44_03885 [Arcobacter sp.]
MTREDLKAKTKEEVLEYIRQKLSFDSSIENNLRHIDKEAFKKEMMPEILNLFLKVSFQVRL